VYTRYVSVCGCGKVFDNEAYPGVDDFEKLENRLWEMLDQQKRFEQPQPQKSKNETQATSRLIDLD
jgi:hypothetical protein